jgi:hypothetical protein
MSDNTFEIVKSPLTKINNNNNMIKDNLSKLYDKLTKFKNYICEDEDEEYENFYNRLNFYFSNIVAELKLQFYEGMKVYEAKEIQFSYRVAVFIL